jgi:hypothetical protein
MCQTHGTPAPRTLQYQPGAGGDFVCTNGNNRYTRALYGSHSDWRLETSDRPIFAVVKKGYHRNIRLVAQVDGTDYPLEQVSPCTASYVNGQRIYQLTGWGGAQLTIRVVALPDSEAAIWQFVSSGLEGSARIKALVCEIAQPKLSRNGDIGADKPGVLEPKGEVLQTAEVALDGNTAYMQVDVNVMKPLAAADGAKQFAAAQQYYEQLAARIQFTTPDAYINTLGGALVLAADGDWDGQTWLHGCIGWRMPLAGWRAGYLGDVLGWPERAISHFDAYAKSQVTNVPPKYSHPTQDDKQNMARARKNGRRRCIPMAISAAIRNATPRCITTT